MKIKQLEWVIINEYPPAYSAKEGKFKYSIHKTFTNKPLSLWFEVIDCTCNEHVKRLATEESIEQLKKIAQSHFENEIKQYLEL